MSKPGDIIEEEAAQESGEASFVEDISVLKAATTKNLGAIKDAFEKGHTLDQRNAAGATALILSCASDTEDREITAWLLKHGCDVNAACRNGDTALHWAAYNGNEGAVELLLSHGADVEAVGDLGNRPLHLACARGHRRCVARLLAAGARTDAKNSYGNDALRLALTIDINKLVTRVRFDTTGTQREKLMEEMLAQDAEAQLQARAAEEEAAKLAAETKVLAGVAKMRRDAEDAEEDRLEEEELIRLEEERMALEDVELRKREEEERLRREEEERNKKKKKKKKGGKKKGEKKKVPK